MFVCLFLCSSLCQKSPNTQENSCWLPPSDYIQSQTLFQTRQDQERGMNGPASLFHSWHRVLFCFFLYFVGVWCAWTEHSAFEHIKVECENFNLMMDIGHDNGHRCHISWSCYHTHSVGSHTICPLRFPVSATNIETSDGALRRYWMKKLNKK